MEDCYAKGKRLSENSYLLRENIEVEEPMVVSLSHYHQSFQKKKPHKLNDDDEE